jgi:phosphoglucosamine mutase
MSVGVERKLFGTDGIREIAGKYPLDEKTITKIGYSVGLVLEKYSNNKTKTIVIGRDTRESGEWILEALASGFSSLGYEILDLGIVPTPLVSFILKKINCMCGIVISASHNPFEYNGIKFFSSNGEKLPDNIELEIEKNILSINEIPNINNQKLILKNINQEAVKYYTDFLISIVGDKFNLNGFKIVVDCANGALFKIAPDFFEKLGAKIVVINNSPDGKNINENCGSLHKDKLIKKILDEKADLGFAFDGDGDRVQFSDDLGSDLDGDHIMAIGASFLKKINKLKNNALVVTIMTNLGLKIAMKKEHIDVFETNVGDRYVYEKMKELDASIGGEQSGHIIFRDFSVTGDGLLTALYVLYIIKSTGKKLSELKNIMNRLPQILLNVKVKAKKDIFSVPVLLKNYNEIKNKLGENGRINVRYSGTELLLRIMIEGENYDEISQMANDFAKLVKENL